MPRKGKKTLVQRRRASKKPKWNPARLNEEFPSRVKVLRALHAAGAAILGIKHHFEQIITKIAEDYYAGLHGDKQPCCTLHMVAECLNDCRMSSIFNRTMTNLGVTGSGVCADLAAHESIHGRETENYRKLAVTYDEEGRVLEDVPAMELYCRHLHELAKEFGVEVSYGEADEQ